MITEQKIKVKWNGKNRQHYESIGYLFTKVGDEFEVNLEELPKGSSSFVQYICDYCNGSNQINEKDRSKKYLALLNQRKTTNKDCCNHSECSSKKMQESWLNNLIKNKNTLGDKFPHLVNEWSKDNEKSPFEYSHGSKCEVWWVCDKGHTWLSSILRRAISGTGCPYCSGKFACVDNCLGTVFPELSKEWNWERNKEITPKDITRGSHKLVWWICKHGHEWKSQVKSRTLCDSGCPQCNESKGEKKIREYLVSENIMFIDQYEFNGLVGLGNKNLRFDFAIMDISNDLCLLIEYDGEFHFKKQFEDDGHEIIIEHDKRKNEYCKTNNIPLLRIPYWDFNNIEEILTKELVKYKLISSNS